MSSVYDKYFLDYEDVKRKLLPSLIKVYGAKYEKLIRERLENSHLNIYITGNDFVNHMKKFDFVERGKLTIKLLEKFGFELTPNDRDKFLGRGWSLLWNDPKESFIEACFPNDRNMYAPGQREGGIYGFEKEWDEKTPIDDFYTKKIETLKAIGFPVPDKFISEDVNLGKKTWTVSPEAIFKEMQSMPEYAITLKKMEDVKAYISGLDAEYEAMREEHSEDFAEVDRLLKIREELHKKHEERYLKEVYKHFPEEREAILKYLSGETTEYKSDFYDKSLETGVDIRYFGTEGERLLKEGKSWERSRIQKTRLEVLKRRGYDISGHMFNYEKAKNFPGSREFVPNKKIIDSLLAFKKKCFKEFEREYALSTGTYSRNKEEIDKLGLLSDDGFDADFMNYSNPCIIPNAVIKNGKPVGFSVMYIPILRLNSDYVDCDFAHEAGHIVEDELLEVTDERLIGKCGFEPFRIKREAVVSTEEGERKKRKYELFSETVHQEIAIAVTEDMHSRGEYIFSSPETAKERGNCAYEDNTEVISSFFKSRRQGIIDARMTTENFGNFKRSFSPRRFEALNDSVREYSKLKAKPGQSDAEKGKRIVAFANKIVGAEAELE